MKTLRSMGVATVFIIWVLLWITQRPSQIFNKVFPRKKLCIIALCATAGKMSAMLDAARPWIKSHGDPRCDLHFEYLSEALPRRSGMWCKVDLAARFLKAYKHTFVMDLDTKVNTTYVLNSHLRAQKQMTIGNSVYLDKRYPSGRRPVTNWFVISSNTLLRRWSDRRSVPNAGHDQDEFIAMLGCNPRLINCLNKSDTYISEVHCRIHCFENVTDCIIHRTYPTFGAAEAFCDVRRIEPDINSQSDVRLANIFSKPNGSCTVVDLRRNQFNDYHHRLKDSSTTYCCRRGNESWSKAGLFEPKEHSNGLRHPSVPLQDVLG
jgi:hypothetical protein